MEFSQAIKDTNFTAPVTYIQQLQKTALPIVLFGAGALASYLLDELRSYNINPVCFCDNDPQKHGSKYLGLDVFSLQQITKQYPEKVFLIATANVDAIYTQLKKLGEQNIITQRLTKFVGDNFDLPFFTSHRHAFEKAYQLFKDDFSKKVFANLIKFKLNGDISLPQSVKAIDIYFDKNIIKLNNNEIFVDIGAFTGDTVLDFTKRTSRQYEHIYALEPDNKYFKILTNTVQNNCIEHISCINCGASDSKGRLYLSAGLNGASSTNTQTTNSESYEINVDTIDNLLSGQRATFLKLDIEGAERAALTGARETITKWHPKIAVSVYHRREDFYDIPCFLLALWPKYNFYLRHYTDTAADTVLYAIP